MKQPNKQGARGKSVAVVLSMVCAVMCGMEECLDKPSVFSGCEGGWGGAWEVSYSYELGGHVEFARERFGGEKMDVEIVKISEEEGTGEEEKKKEKSTRAGRRESELPEHILRSATVENLEEVIDKNIKVLDAVREASVKDLEGQTDCKAGSLEWIARAQGQLKHVLEKMGREGEEEEEEEEKEIKQLLRSAVKGYEEELRDRREFLARVTQFWIPRYRKALDSLLEHKEKVMELLQAGRLDSIHLGAVKKLDVHFQALKSMARVVKRGIEDAVEQREIGDIRRNERLSITIEKRRTYKMTEGSSKDGKHPTYARYHVKHTFFYPISAALTYNRSIKNSEKRRKMAKSRVLQIRLEECRDTYRALEKDRAHLDVCLALSRRRGEEGRRIEKRLEGIKTLIASRIAEVEILEDAYKYVEECVVVEEGRALSASFMHLSYLEAIESYFMGEGEKGVERLEEVLKTFYRMGRESGHLKNLREMDGGEEMENRYMDEGYKYRMMSDWLAAIHRVAGAAKAEIQLLGEEISAL